MHRHCNTLILAIWTMKFRLNAAAAFHAQGSYGVDGNMMMMMLNAAQQA